MSEQTRERFDAWSFLREVLSRGGAIEQDTRGSGRGYEQHSFRLDAAASEWADKLKPHLVEPPPADDAEPVTADHLKRIGFGPAMNNSWLWARASDGRFALAVRVDLSGWQITTVNEEDYDSAVEIPVPSTVGDVRRLLAALKVPAREGGAE